MNSNRWNFIYKEGIINGRVTYIDEDSAEEEEVDRMTYMDENSSSNSSLEREADRRYNDLLQHNSQKYFIAEMHRIKKLLLDKD